MPTVAELLVLLSGHRLEGAALAQAVARVLAAPDDPELAWIDGAANLTAFALYDRLFDWVVEGDKLDEIHALLAEAFSQPLPPFPHGLPEARGPAYFRWLDGWLAARGQALASIDFGVDDELHLLVIERADAGRVAELAEALALRIRIEDGR